MDMLYHSTFVVSIFQEPANLKFEHFIKYIEGYISKLVMLL